MRFSNISLSDQSGDGLMISSALWAFTGRRPSPSPGRVGAERHRRSARSGAAPHDLGASAVGTGPATDLGSQSPSLGASGASRPSSGLRRDSRAPFGADRRQSGRHSADSDTSRSGRRPTAGGAEFTAPPGLRKRRRAIYDRPHRRHPIRRRRLSRLPSCLRALRPAGTVKWRERQARPDRRNRNGRSVRLRFRVGRRQFAGHHGQRHSDGADYLHGPQGGRVRTRLFQHLLHPRSVHQRQRPAVSRARLALEHRYQFQRRR